VTPELWRALGVAGALVVLYALVVVLAVRRYGLRSRVATAVAVLVGSLAWAILWGGQSCPRLGHLAGLAAWLPVLVLLGIPAAAGALAATSNLRWQRSMPQSVGWVAGATAAGLCVSAVLAFITFVAFYGPDCWP
jgi:hypothetical protein